MMTHRFKKEVDAFLLKYGGLYTFDDIMDLIHQGKMQSFAVGDSWAVTQIAEFPRKKVLDIVFMIGNFPELQRMEADAIKYAIENNCDMVMANGLNRLQAACKIGLFVGWQQIMSTYTKDLRNGN